jgi:hypothetical protein
MNILLALEHKTHRLTIVGLLHGQLYVPLWDGSVRGAHTAFTEKALTPSWAHELTNSWEKKHGICPPFCICLCSEPFSL